jgi:hypothetical protein
MACPLFIPSSPLGELASGSAPLGDLYGGNCAAAPDQAVDPETLRRYCNFGYGRGHCSRAAQSDADAVRFMVRAARGSVVEIAWAVERNHHPVAVGSMEIDARLSPSGDVLARQAHACAAAYARQSPGRPVDVAEIAAAARL